MRKILPLRLTLMMLLGLISGTEAQTTYTINSNTSWATSSLPGYCNTCTFNIAASATLTLDASTPTCANCTFNGGAIKETTNFTCQSCTFSATAITINSTNLSLQNSTITFTNSTLTANGTTSISGNAPIVLTGSNFTFNNTANISFSYTLNLTNSKIYLYSNSFLTGTGTALNLMSGSQVIVGDGSASSKAYLYMNGATVNVYDTSTIAVENKNNYYFNWSAYNYYASTASATHKSYPTTSNNLNCGGSGQNSCAAPNVYGSATLNSAGLSSSLILPVVLGPFSAKLTTSNTVSLSWSTEEEVNSDYFEIQRSTDSKNWESLGNVEAKGSSAVLTEYSFDDVAPSVGANDYRLQMVDRDGKTAYSPVISIKTVSIDHEISIFPNPMIHSTFNIKITESNPIQVNVFSMEGKLLFQTSLQGQSVYHVNLPSNLATGNFLAIQVISNGKTNAFKVMNK
jgi:hypothetical protein